MIVSFPTGKASPLHVLLVENAGLLMAELGMDK